MLFIELIKILSVNATLPVKGMMPLIFIWHYQQATFEIIKFTNILIKDKTKFS